MRGNQSQKRSFFCSVLAPDIIYQNRRSQTSVIPSQAVDSSRKSALNLEKQICFRNRSRRYGGAAGGTYATPISEKQSRGYVCQERAGRAQNPKSRKSVSGVRCSLDVSQVQSHSSVSGRSQRDTYGEGRAEHIFETRTALNSKFRKVEKKKSNDTPPQQTLPVIGKSHLLQVGTSRSSNTTCRDFGRQEFEKIRDRLSACIDYQPKENHPDVRKIYSQVLYAIKSGRLIKPDRCSRCNRKERLHGHHKDYSKPLGVDWYCTACHKEVELQEKYEVQKNAINS